MGGGVNLYGGPQKSEAADVNFTCIQNHAVEVEVNWFSKIDVISVVAEEGRLHPDGISAAGQ